MTGNNVRWRGCEEMRTWHIAGGIVKWCSQFGKVCQCLRMFNIELPQYPAISLLSINPKELKMGIQIKICT